MLSGVNGASPWAATASESASYLVEAALGGYSSRLVTEWRPPDEYDWVEVASLVRDHPNVWSDGSLVLDQVTGVSSSGAVFFFFFFFLLTSLWTFGVIGGGVRLILFALRVTFSPVEVSVLFVGLFSLSKELRCGCHFGLAVFWCCSPGC